MNKKIKLSTVEDFLEVKLQPNLISIGFDVSMYNTGIALIRTTDSYLVLEKIHKISIPKESELLEGINSFLDQLDDFKREIVSQYQINLNIIEDCFFGQNVKTLKTLARFSILVYDRFRGIVKATQFMMPTSARSQINFSKKDKKSKGEALKKEIIEYVNKALDIDNKDPDIADAIVLSLAGLCKGEGK